MESSGASGCTVKSNLGKAKEFVVSDVF